VVGRKGKKTAGFPVSGVFRMTKGRYSGLPRSDLAAFIFHRIEDRTEAISGDTIERLEQNPEGVSVVTFARSGKRDFDLVIGADGLHSRVRELASAPKATSKKISAIRPRPSKWKATRRAMNSCTSCTHRSASRSAASRCATTGRFTFADEDPTVPPDVASQKALLRNRFGGSGWECPRIFEAMDRSTDLYIDRVSEIHMGSEQRSSNYGSLQGSWTRGRVSLIGDAAFCVSLLAGQGSALAMIAAYVLAGELHRANGNCAEAFARYESLFGPFVAAKQKAALRFAGSFAPKSKLSLFIRNRIFDLLAVPGIADLVIGRDLADKIALPDYERFRFGS